MQSIEQKHIDPIGHITLSIGVASRHDDEHFEAVLQRADTALYQAKEDGRNRVEVSQPDSVPKTATMVKLKPR